MRLNLDLLKLDPWAPRGALRWAVLALAVALAASSGYALAADRVEDESLPAGVALRIGDDEITEEALTDRIATLQALYGVTPPAEDDPAADSFRRDAAKSFVIGEILERETERRDIVVPSKKVRAELNKIIDERLAGDSDAFARFLGDEGITEEAVLGEIARTIATSQLYAEVVADVPDATIAQAREQFDTRRDEMTTPERRTLSNIVVESEADAEAVLAELAGGTPFAEVAAVSSLDTRTKDKGGDLGTVASADLDPTYAAAAFAAKKGEPFGPVRSEFGWNVGLVRAVKPGQKLSFADVKVTLLTSLTTKAQTAAWQEFLGDLLDRADAEYAADYRPEDPTSPLSGSGSPTAPAEEQ